MSQFSLLKHSSTPRTDYLVLRRCINRMVKEILQLALSCQASELSYLARSSAGRAALGIKPREGWRLLGSLEWEWWRCSIVPCSLQSQETWQYQYCWMTWSKSVFNANTHILVCLWLYHLIRRHWLHLFIQSFWTCWGTESQPAIPQQLIKTHTKNNNFVTCNKINVKWNKKGNISKN